MKARVLIVGGEGRAHALGWKIAQSSLVEKIYFAPGNGGTSEVGENINIGVDEFEKLADFAEREKIDLTVVSPEPPLANGIADFFESRGLKIFGPSKAAAQIEASKVFSTDFMQRYKIPNPESVVVNSAEEARAYMQSKSFKDYVIKSSGLAAGKGVVVPESQEEAEAAIKDIMEDKIFGSAGDQVVFQERLYGQEVSVFALSDGKNIVMLPFVQDHKQLNDGDKGPNTGGMGAYSPPPFMNAELAKKVKEKIMQPVIDGMRAGGTPYKGVLFGGLFIEENGEPKAIEFNCRFGDPECQALMMLIDEDIYPILLKCATGELEDKDIKVKPGNAAIVCVATPGYPMSPITGEVIYGLENVVGKDINVFHAGTTKNGDEFVASGGRVVGITAYGDDLKQALQKAYAQIGEQGIHFKDMHYRTDIGHRVL